MIPDIQSLKDTLQKLLDESPSTEKILEAFASHIAEKNFILLPQEPTEAMWDGLARQIIFWMDMHPKTPRALFNHLKSSGYEIPTWLRDEFKNHSLDHTPPKGTRVVMVYRAMIDSYIKSLSDSDTSSEALSETDALKKTISQLQAELAQYRQGSRASVSG